jgi:folate-dependent phosphoribosylglycinamide formyltransferase PurN
MKIVLLAVDDEFAGEMQRVLYEAHPDWIVGSVISSCTIYKHTELSGLFFVLRKSGFAFLAEMIRMKLVRPFLEEGRSFPSRLAQQHKVEQFVTENINDAKSIAKLRSWDPDLIISTNFSHYIGRTVRESVARYGCWNLHKSLLPQYRGIAPSFHALLEGAKTVGATLHQVSKSFDDGDVLAQMEVQVLPTDSIYCLNRKTSEAGGRLLCSFLERDPLSARGTPQPEGDWKYYSYPTQADVRAFRNKGLRFVNPPGRVRRDDSLPGKVSPVAKHWLV